MKIVTIIRRIIALGLFAAGILAALWGGFCLFGGPDPGAGSSGDSVKYALAFFCVGVLLLFFGLSILRRKKPNKPWCTNRP